MQEGQNGKITLILECEGTRVKREIQCHRLDPVERLRYFIPLAESLHAFHVKDAAADLLDLLARRSAAEAMAQMQEPG